MNCCERRKGRKYQLSVIPAFKNAAKHQSLCGSLLFRAFCNRFQNWSWPGQAGPHHREDDGQGVTLCDNFDGGKESNVNFTPAPGAPNQ